MTLSVFLLFLVSLFLLLLLREIDFSFLTFHLAVMRGTMMHTRLQSECYQGILLRVFTSTVQATRKREATEQCLFTCLKMASPLSISLSLSFSSLSYSSDFLSLSVLERKISMRRPRQELIEKGVLKEISENGTAASLIVDSLIAKLFYRFKIREFPVLSVNFFTL